jgi:hypothetical protein
MTAARKKGVTTTPRADAKSDTEAAKAVTDSSSEMSHKNQTDINSEEAISTYVTIAVKDAVSHSGDVQNVALQILQNATTHANNLISNANVFVEEVRHQALRHADIAIDRQWNLDEVADAAAILLGRMAASMNNPIPPDES